MALSAAKLEYFRKYREEHKEETKAARMKWEAKNARNRYHSQPELSKAKARKSYYKSVGKLEKVAEEQALIDELRVKYPKKRSGALLQFVGPVAVDRRKATVRKARYKHVIGITSLKEPDACEVCGKGGKICMDHDHVTKKFRGWLCNDCNLALGRAQDDIGVLAGLISYLQKHKGES